MKNVCRAERRETAERYGCVVRRSRGWSVWGGCRSQMHRSNFSSPSSSPPPAPLPSRAPLTTTSSNSSGRTVSTFHSLINTFSTRTLVFCRQHFLPRCAFLFADWGGWPQIDRSILTDKSIERNFGC